MVKSVKNRKEASSPIVQSSDPSHTLRNIVIPVVLVLAAALLILSVSRPPELKTVAVAPPPFSAEQEQPSPQAPQAPDVGTPTPRAPQVEPPQGGIPASYVFPQEVNFWVNNIMVPASMSYDGGNYIPLKTFDIKTYAGSFGPYAEDPTDHLTVKLCAQLSKGVAAEACEIVPINFRDHYVSFARGYQYDEYIGASAAKDYFAYYVIYLGDTRVGESNHAAVRTIKDV